MQPPRLQTRRVLVGTVAIGGSEPVSIQSMLTTPTRNAQACLAQTQELAAAGCEIVRAAVESSRDLDGFAQLCAGSPLPVVADIHFDYRLAVEAARRGAAKLRINPGNIGSKKGVDAVIDAAGEAGIPLRIGVNAGSLAPELQQRNDLDLPQKLVHSACEFVHYFEERGVRNLVVSAKASNVMATVETYRQLARCLPQVPLHLGVTEAGTAWAGTIKSAAGIGTLLAEGIGNTLRVSLTAAPVEEVRVARTLLQALDLRAQGPQLVSCPTCSRCKVDLISLAQEVEQRLAGLEQQITVAVMGCVVNGPGEAAHADYGVACGRGTGALFAKGQVLYTVAEDEIIEALLREIETSLP